MPYDMHKVIESVVDDGDYFEYGARWARNIVCAFARMDGKPVGIVGNQPMHLAGVLDIESAEKAARFVMNCNQDWLPILFLQDVNGFMVGRDSEQEGIIRAGARFVEAMATARVPKLVLTVNHASGAGYYAMAGQGFDPDFIYSWPTGRMGVMEGDSAVQAVFGSQLEKLKKNGQAPDAELIAEMDKVRETYDEELDAKYAAARGFVDAVIAPEFTRDALELSLRTSLNYTGPHIGQFVLPANLV
jgi:acetyl-CoA carboxylase carboxyltransferase component